MRIASAGTARLRTRPEWRQVFDDIQRKLSKKWRVRLMGTGLVHPRRTPEVDGKYGRTVFLYLFVPGRFVSICAVGIHPVTRKIHQPTKEICFRPLGACAARQKVVLRVSGEAGVRSVQQVMPG